MIFGVLYVDTSRKFRKNPIFWAKSISTIFENFERISTEVGSPPPPSKIGLVLMLNRKGTDLIVQIRDARNTFLFAFQFPKFSQGDHLHDFSLRGVRLQIFRARSGRKLRLRRRFKSFFNFSERLFLQNGIKSKNIGTWSQTNFPESVFREWLWKVFRIDCFIKLQ